jgi:hypothetical protein
MPEAYQYSILPSETHIRVLRARGSLDENEDVHCDVIDIPLESPVEYDAISYVWQDQNVDLPIYIREQILKVTGNCIAILKNLRPKTRGDSTLLWIDQICINQKDQTNEKSRQMGLMGKIYSTARHIVVWLRPAPESMRDPVQDNQQNRRVCTRLAQAVKMLQLEETVIEQAPIDGKLAESTFSRIG